MIKSKDLLIKKIVVASIIILIILLTTISKENTKDILNKEVSEQKTQDTVAVYLQNDRADDGYSKSDTIPTEGYTFNENASYCTINGNRDDIITLSYNADTQTLSVSPLTTKGTKCYLYFDEQKLVKDTLLSYYPTVRTRTNFNSTVTDTTTGVIYKSADSSQYDNDGEVYYFAGNPTDNWVYFAGFYWRIIRINGDGSIRLIYHGTSTDATESNAQIKIEDNNIFSFNTTINDNMYVGFKYTNGEVHGTQIDSTIKLKLDEWYDNNLMLYENTLNINSGFCNDRTLYSGTGIGIDNTYYSPYDRLVTKTTPTLKCDTNDLFTDTLSTKGNKSLTNPVGLITADEVAFAGAVYAMSNSSYYLYTGTYFWTISPHSYSRSNVYANVFSVDMDGAIGYRRVNYEYGVRPVINLRSDVTISSGNGTASQPFVINTD